LWYSSRRETVERIVYTGAMRVSKLLLSSEMRPIADGFAVRRVICGPASMRHLVAASMATS